MLRTFFKRVDDLIFGKLHDQYARELEKEVMGYETLLDVACGAYSPVKRVSAKLKHVVGIDMFQPSIDRSRDAGIHSDYKLMNALDIEKEFGLRSFDCVVASDLIEHLTKEDGLLLLKHMEGVAKNKVVVYTPNGFLKQSTYDNNDLQVHQSGWEIEEMQRLGYQVKGINGWKSLRGEFAEVKLWPKIFWGRISLLSQFFTTTSPKHAFGIMCVKDVTSEP